MEPSINIMLISSCEPQEPEENITHMDAWLYKAAAEGNIEVFNNNQGLPLESLKTPNHDNVLHLNLATQENAVSLFNRFLLKFMFFPVQYEICSPSLPNLITRLRGEKRSDFIEQILTKCPSLLLQTNAKGQTPLHVAARYGHSAIVKLLIKSCAKPRDGDLEKLGKDQVNAVREMLRIRDQESNTALHEAARCGNVEVVKALLEFEDPDFPYSANEKQETPLYIAARRGSERLLTLLFDKFKSTPHGGSHGRTALHAAAMAGDAEAVKVILKKKGNLTKERDEDGHTPLHYAAHLGFKSVVEELLKWDVSAAYIGDKKRGMTPLLMATRQGNDGTVSKILSLCPDCCEKVDNKGLNFLHYLAFRGSSSPLGHSTFKYKVFKLAGVEIAYGSVNNLMEWECDFGMTPQEVYSTLHYKRYHHKEKEIKKFWEEIENDRVAEYPVHRLPTISPKNFEKKREAHLIVAALIATVAFAAAITVPGGLQSEKESKQDTPKNESGTALLIDEAAFKAFVVTNAMAFIFSVCVLTIHFGFQDNILFKLRLWRVSIIYETPPTFGLLASATVAMVIAFSTGSYVVLKHSHELVIVSYLICPTFFFFMWLILSNKVSLDNI